MVARMISSSRSWSLVVFAGICLAAVALTLHWAHLPEPKPAAAQSGGEPPEPGTVITPSDAATLLSNHPLDHCYNFRTGSHTCQTNPAGCLLPSNSPLPTSAPCGSNCAPSDPCLPNVSSPEPSPNQTGAPTNSDGSGVNQPGSLTASFSEGSVIDNQSIHFLHYGDDYLMGAASGLYIRRIHRYRDAIVPSSFGPYVFCNYNISLQWRDWGIYHGSGVNWGGVISIHDGSQIFGKYFLPGQNHQNYSVYEAHPDLTGGKFSPHPVADTIQINASTVWNSSEQPLPPGRPAGTGATIQLRTGETLVFELIEAEPPVEVPVAAAGTDEYTAGQATFEIQPIDGRLADQLRLPSNFAARRRCAVSDPTVRAVADSAHCGPRKAAGTEPPKHPCVRRLADDQSNLSD